MQLVELKPGDKFRLEGQYYVLHSHAKNGIVSFCYLGDIIDGPVPDVLVSSLEEVELCD